MLQRHLGELEYCTKCTHCLNRNYVVIHKPGSLELLNTNIISPINIFC